MAHSTVTDADFDEKVMKADKPILVDFWATWCGPCKMQNPILEELDSEGKDAFTIAKIDVDANPATAQKFGVMSIPTLMIFKGGQVVKQFVGVQSKDVLKAALQ